jgi:citrate lyase subunit beta/citryl-CoA lyase
MVIGSSVLFVPGNRTDRITKAMQTAAPAVAVDLEDAVVDDAKEAARKSSLDTLRALLRQRMPGRSPSVFIRINGVGTSWSAGDLTAVAALLQGDGGGLSGVIVPKVESPAQVEAVDEVLTTAEHTAGAPVGWVGLLPIIETARGLVAAIDIAAAAPRVATLVFGTLDLAAALGITPSVEGHELLHARSRLVIATAAAGLPGPLDGPHADLDDPEGLRRSSLRVRNLGFTGRVVLHPKQLPVVQEAFAPSEDELARAREVVQAFGRAQEEGTGAIRLPDGTFIDRPVLTRARALLGLNEADAVDRETTSPAPAHPGRHR